MEIGNFHACKMEGVSEQHILAKNAELRLLANLEPWS